MFLSGITIIQFLRGAVKPAKATYEKVQPVIEEKIEQRKRNRASIDVPLDGETPVKPDESKKEKSKKAGGTEQMEEVVATQQIIDEINAANAKNKAEREKRNLLMRLLSTLRQRAQVQITLRIQKQSLR